MDSGKVLVVKGGKYLNAQGTFGAKSKANPFGSQKAAKGFMTRKDVLGREGVTFEPIEGEATPPIKAQALAGNGSTKGAAQAKPKRKAAAR